MREICGDVYLTFRQKCAYIALNLPRGMWGYFSLLKSTHVSPSIAFTDVSTESPTRHLLDIAFSHLLQKSVAKKEISVFDIGCGRGYVRDMLAKAGYYGTYTGIDMVREDNYTDTHTAFSSSLIVGDVTTAQLHELYDVVISMTVLEHVIDDFAAVAVAHRIVKPGGVQMHIVPMFPTIFLYLWHGYRQYNKRRLMALFGQADSNLQYYRVGGLGSFVAHWCWITLPERLLGIGSLRRKFPIWYRCSLYYSFKIDRFLPFLATAFIIVKRNP